MNSKKTSLIVISAALCMTFAMPGAWAGKAGRTTAASPAIVQKKASAAGGRQPAVNPTPKAIQRPVQQPAVGVHLKSPDRKVLRLPPSGADLQGRLPGDRVGQRRGGIQPVEDGPGLMPEHVRRLKDKLAMEQARFRDHELGLSTPLPEGIDPGDPPGPDGPEY